MAAANGVKTRSLVPSTRPEIRLYFACDDVKPARRFVVNSGNERYPLGQDVEAIGLELLASILAGL